MLEKTQRHALMVSIATMVAAGCAPNEQHYDTINRSCDISSLSSVFDDPVTYFNVTFCGEVRLLYESRTIKIFPIDQPLPQDRTDIVIVPDANTFRRVRGILEQEREVIAYIEGELITHMPECFENSTADSEVAVACLPHRRPMDINVTHIRIRFS